MVDSATENSDGQAPSCGKHLTFSLIVAAGVAAFDELQPIFDT